jgi:glycosyltransferase involved in cell wall biosynthesis
VNSGGAGEEYAAREEAEWQEADLILCGSEFVKDGIRACGGPVDRVAVVPYGVDTSPNLRERRETGGPLRVLTVGAVGLRKGSPYVLEAARLLGRQVEFRMVGPLGVSDQVRSLLSRHIEVVGSVPRSRISEHYRWADVFLLPSLCEGSATATYEALSWGLPVVCTPNTGSVVRDGVDGFVVPIRDARAIAARIDKLARSRDLLAEMANNARERARDFSLAWYGQRLLAALDDALRAGT